MAQHARGSLFAGAALAVGCVIAVSACSAASPRAVAPAAVATSTQSAPPAVAGTTPASAVPSVTPSAAPVRVGKTVSESDFYSPSHNITCEIDYQRGGGLPDGTRCQTFSPSRSVTMSISGAYTTCTGGNCLGDPGEHTPVLPYGYTSRIGPFACVSQTSGVTCTVSGRGFAIARAGITAARGSPLAAAPTVTALGLASLVGTWGQHEAGVVIAHDGLGHLSYADLRRCPSCSFGTAPRGTVDFILSSVGNGVAAGRVTGSSDQANYGIGNSVRASTSPAAPGPGRFLNLVFAGRPSLPFCDKAAAGQCGA